MRVVLAALDESPAAGPVLATASRFADAVGAELEAIHVDARGTFPALVAERAGVPLRVVTGEVVDCLLAALDDDNVVALVVGARRTTIGRRPAGRTAMQVIARATTPVVVVPPGVVTTARPLRRLVVPLNGTDPHAEVVLQRVCPLFGDVDLFVVHVFTEATTPRVLDRPQRDLAMLGGEFAARTFPPATTVDLRTGTIGSRIEDVCRERDADLVVMSWSQDLSSGRAAVVQDVLARTDLPVLLMPIA
jgi:nucleotide-binding universal stress UspA family protein